MAMTSSTGLRSTSSDNAMSDVGDPAHGQEHLVARRVREREEREVVAELIEAQVRDRSRQEVHREPHDRALLLELRDDGGNVVQVAELSRRRCDQDFGRMLLLHDAKEVLIRAEDGEIGPRRLVPPPIGDQAGDFETPVAMRVHEGCRVGHLACAAGDQHASRLAAVHQQPADHAPQPDHAHEIEQQEGDDDRTADEGLARREDEGDQQEAGDRRPRRG